jgi:hypothetical protein
VCNWRATYCWKTFDKGYNFSLNITSIRCLHTKSRAPKVMGVPILGISELPLGSPGTKWHLGVGLLAMHKSYYKGEGGGFSSHGESCESMFAHGSSVHQKCSSYVVTNLWFGLCRFVWVIDCLSIFLVPILELQHALLPPKCYEPKSMPQFLPLSSLLDL